MTEIIDRIERELGVPGVAALLAERLEPTDLQSLLLDVYRRIAARRQPAAVLADYAANRFVRPSSISPAQLLAWDTLASSLLPPECELIELSPVCPLGACSVVADIGQDRSIATIRNTQVVSDSTNVLALEAACRRRDLLRAGPRSTSPVHLAASHRLVRGQRYRDPKLASHFRVFSLCSAGRHRGDFFFESASLALHIDFYLSAIRAHLGASIPLRLSLTVFESARVFDSAAEELLAGVRRRFAGVEAVLAPDRQEGRAYYRHVCFWIHAANDAGDAVHLVDGGAVDWTQRLLSNAKERLIVSGIGSERLCSLRKTSNRL